MAIKVRKRLLGMTREFFERELPGLVSWQTVQKHIAEELPRDEDGRRNPLGKHREQVVMSFLDFRLTVSSPVDDPPLGWIEVLHLPSKAKSEGPLDHAIWQNAGKFIKERLYERRGQNAFGARPAVGSGGTGGGSEPGTGTGIAAGARHRADA